MSIQSSWRAGSCPSTASATATTVNDGRTTAAGAVGDTSAGSVGVVAGSGCDASLDSGSEAAAGSGVMASAGTLTGVADAGRGACAATGLPLRGLPLPTGLPGMDTDNRAPASQQKKAQCQRGHCIAYAPVAVARREMRCPGAGDTIGTAGFGFGSSKGSRLSRNHSINAACRWAAFSALPHTVSGQAQMMRSVTDNSPLLLFRINDENVREAHVVELLSGAIAAVQTALDGSIRRDARPLGIDGANGNAPSATHVGKVRLRRLRRRDSGAA